MRLTEKEFLAQIVEMAGLCGWLCYHTHDSRRSAAGYPDLTLVHPFRRELVFAELKVGRSRPSFDQRCWLAALAEAGARAYVWKPEDWDSIEAILMGEVAA